MNRRSFIAGAAALSLAAARRSSAAETPKAAWRVGVIGHTGRGNYGHGLDTVWREVPGTQVVAVADADERASPPP